MKWTLILTIILLPTLCCSSSGCSSPTLTSLATGCLCAGNNLQLLCSVIDGVNTVWTGSAIVDQCSKSDNIILRHSGFSGTVSRSCNSEAVIAQSLPSLSNISANCYTSQLSISVTDDLNGTDIRCQIDNNTQPFPEVGQYIINLTSEPYSPPNDVQLIDIASEGLTFNWTSVDPTCSDVSYRVSATGCGNCPSSTNATTIICSGIEQQSEDTQTCTLSVQSVVCDNITSNFSDPVNVSLQVTDLPRASILPRYWQNTTNLAGFVVEITTDPIVVSGISVTVKSYRVEYFNSVTGDFCGPTAILNLMNESTTCTSNNVCKVRRELILLESCGNVDIGVTISATSVLGSGPPTQPLRIDGTNKFVNVTFDSVTNKFYCTYLNQQDTSGKSCNVSYAPCGDQLIQTAMGYTNTERPNLVEIQLNIPESITYCYIAAASNDTFKILIEGRIVKSGGEEADDHDGLKPGSVAGIVLGIIFFLILCIGGTLILIVVYIARRSRRYKCKNVDHEQPPVEMITQTDTDTKKCESEDSGPPKLQIESVPATDKTDNKDDSVPRHDHNDRAMEVEDKPDSDHNQKLAISPDSNVSETVNTTLGTHETTNGSKSTTDHDQSSDQVQKISSADPDRSHTEESTDNDNKTTNTTPARDRPPEWIPDKDAPTCMRCNKEFSLFNRRHHCRYCGEVMCDSCTRMSTVPWQPSKINKVCSQCHEVLSVINNGKNH